MRQVFKVVLDYYWKEHLAGIHDASAYCRNWRDVRALLRGTYKGSKVHIIRSRWGVLPYRGFWSHN